VQRKAAAAGTGPAGRSDDQASTALSARRTEEVRTRIRLMIEITARGGAYRKGLVSAAKHLSPEEAAIISDLERHGMQVPQLRDVLCGGHVLVDDPRLYEDWRFASVSHQRLSSHHRDIDKALYPDIGMRGAVVREKLHGRTAQGTWVQLEKTPAAFGKRKLPDLNDLRHLMDYVIYRITRSNVGPWGLSRVTERWPMYLSPMLAVPTSLSSDVARALAATLRRIEEQDDVTAVSKDLAARFPPPERADPGAELGQALSGRAGRGLFGSSEVWVTETLAPSAGAVLAQHYQAQHYQQVSGGAGPGSSEEAEAMGDEAAPATGPASVPEGLVTAVVELVDTGPVLLGAYTIAELAAVDAIVDFLETRPSDEVLAEAVRSLAARQLLVGGSDGEQVRVRGDLGIAVAFQQRARMVLDARATGTAPGEPWRILLLPQPEHICMVIRIDALGVHEIGLYTSDDALKLLDEWLPGGPLADPDDAVNADTVLAGAQRSALVTVTHYTAEGTAEVAGSSTDLVLARDDGRLHLFTRDPGNRSGLVPDRNGKDVHDTLVDLLA